jgi:hypothetical protein
VPSDFNFGETALFATVGSPARVVGGSMIETAGASPGARASRRRGSERGRPDGVMEGAIHPVRAPNGPRLHRLHLAFVS